MKEWVSSLSRELGSPPTSSKIKTVYVEAFQELLGVKLVSSRPSDEEWRIFRKETKPRHTSDDWLSLASPRYKVGRSIKIAHDVRVVEVDHKAGKLVRLRAELRNDVILDVCITGDFFILPKEVIGLLEDSLVGVKLEENVLKDRIEKIFLKTNAQSPGVSVQDFTDAFLKLKQYT